MRPLAALLSITLLVAPAVARKPRPPTGTLTLDMADPVITAIVAGVPLRLRVGLEHKPLIELNPEAAARLPIAFEPGVDAWVGRDSIPGRAAEAPITIDRRPVVALISTHDRHCCDGVDGVISPSVLPYAEVVFERDGARSGRAFALDMVDSDRYGLEAPTGSGKQTIRLQFSLERGDSVATAAAGAILAHDHGGRFEPGGLETPAAFGLTRPARTVRFDRSFTLAGFGFDRLVTRIADFGGHERLPGEPAGQGAADDIVVARRIAPQEAWPVVLIGRDRLDRCGRITYSTIDHRLTLDCDFDR